MSHIAGITPLGVGLPEKTQGAIRGNVKSHWLQPPYSAASCRQPKKEKLYIAAECCSNLAAARGYGC